MIKFEDDSTLVVPTRQRALAVRLELARRARAEGARTWRTPDVIPLEGWLIREIERRAAEEPGIPRVLSSTEDWWHWRAATADVCRDLPLLAPAVLADELRSADELASQYRLDARPWADSAGPEARVWLEVRRSVATRSREARADTAARIADEVGALGGERPVHFAGFGVGTPALRALHAARRERGLPGEWFEPDIAAAAEPSLVLAADELDELERMASWCLAELERAPDARLLIVSGGTADRREELAELIRGALAPQRAAGDLADARANVAVEGGQSLALQPIAQYALKTLTWLIDGLDFDTFSPWIRGPWGPLDAPQAAKLDLWFRREARARYDVNALLALPHDGSALEADIVASLVQRVQAARAALGGGDAVARNWSERLLAVLEAWGWPGKAALSSEEQQTRARFVEQLGALGALPAAVRWSAHDALRTLRELVARERFQPATGDALVTITASHADPVVRYDGIWVAGLQADRWPAPAKLNPYLPVGAQRAAGMPQASSAGQLEIARQALVAWRAATPQLVISAAGTLEGGAQAPSPLLRDWPSKPSTALTSIWLPVRLFQATLLDAVEDATGRVWPSASPLPAGARSLELQNLCPFKAHAELRLGAEAIEGYTPGISPKVRGIWLHAALAAFWCAISDSRTLAALDQAAIAEHADTSVREHAPRGPRDAAFRREHQRLVDLLVCYSILERTRAPFEVIATETPRTLSIGGGRLDLRVDRIDRLGRPSPGSLAIIDYKSGSERKDDWEGDRPTATQLFTYLAAVGNEAVAAAFLYLSDGAATYRGRAAAVDLLPEVEVTQAAWSDEVMRWRAHLATLAADFLRGDARVDPVRGACKRCTLDSLCRIGERRADSEDE